MPATLFLSYGGHIRRYRIILCSGVRNSAVQSSSEKHSAVHYITVYYTLPLSLPLLYTPPSYCLDFIGSVVVTLSSGTVGSRIYYNVQAVKDTGSPDPPSSSSPWVLSGGTILLEQRGVKFNYALLFVYEILLSSLIW